MIYIIHGIDKLILFKMNLQDISIINFNFNVYPFSSCGKGMDFRLKKLRTLKIDGRKNSGKITCVLQR